MTAEDRLRASEAARKSQRLIVELLRIANNSDNEALVEGLFSLSAENRTVLKVLDAPADLRTQRTTALNGA